MNKDVKQKGRKLTHLLRHEPSKYGVELDDAGWCDVDKICIKLGLRRSEIEDIVDSDNKGRFSFSKDGLSIRANQGHSITVNLGLLPITPPDTLFHGTVEKYIKWIQKEGLKKMSRHHVHLSSDVDTAEQVASRRSTENILLTINAKDMHKDGYEFFMSENGVWLTDHVPTRYIQNI